MFKGNTCSKRQPSVGIVDQLKHEIQNMQGNILYSSIIACHQIHTYLWRSHRNCYTTSRIIKCQTKYWKSTIIIAYIDAVCPVYILVQTITDKRLNVSHDLYFTYWISCTLTVSVDIALLIYPIAWLELRERMKYQLYYQAFELENDKSLSICKT